MSRINYTLGSNKGERRALEEFQANNPSFEFEDWKSYSTFGKSFGGLIGTSRQTIRFTYDKSPYENLVALGINKMSNKELLKAINKYYTQQLPSSIEFIDGIEEEYLPKTRKSEEEAVERGVLKKQFVKRDGDNKWSVMYQSNPNQLLNDEQFYQSMINEFQYMSNSLGRLRNLIRYNKALIKLVEKT